MIVVRKVLPMAKHNKKHMLH